MGLFGKKRPAVLDYTSAVNPPPRMGDPLASLGGYDRNAAMQGQSGFAPMNQGFSPPEQKKPGFFSKGGAWLDVLGAFGDGFGTNGPVYAQSKMQRSKLMQEAQMQEQQRMQEREDYLWKQQNQATEPTAMERNLAAYSRFTPEQRRLYGEMNPLIQTLGDGSSRAVNRYDVVQPQRSGPAPGTVEDGHEFIGGDPSNPASWRPVGGGGGSNVTRGF